MLEITVHEVRGRCPVHAVGDRIVIDGPHIISSQTDALCTHALATLLHYTTILEHAWCPVTLGLSTPDDPTHAYMQCVDPGPPFTDGGTVVFRCRQTEDHNADGRR
ncbi:MAG: TIGR04076 family protein [Halobacteriota archaeon]